MNSFEIENEKTIMVIQSRIIDLTSQQISKTGVQEDIEKMLQWNKHLLFMMYEDMELEEGCYLEN